MDYKADLHSKLVDMTLPVSMSCEDPHCRDPAHSTERDSHMLDMLCSVIESSHSVIPLAGGQRAGSGTGRSDFTSGCVPGWKEEVEPFQEDARFWHSLWLSAGKPNRGDFYTAMRRSRNQYHYAVRRTRRSRDLQRAKKLFEASLEGDMQLIKEMK